MTRTVSGDEAGVNMSPTGQDWCEGPRGVYCDSAPPDQGRDVAGALEEIRLWVQSLSSGGDTAAITKDSGTSAAEQETRYRTRIVRHYSLVAFKSFTQLDDHNLLIKQQASYILSTKHKSSLLPEFRSTGNNLSGIKLFFSSLIYGSFIHGLLNLEVIKSS